MSDRPSPRAIISKSMIGKRPYDQALKVLDDLAVRGYWIIHDDDRRRLIRAAWTAGTEEPAPFYWEGGEGFDDDLCPYGAIIQASDEMQRAGYE